MPETLHIRRIGDWRTVDEEPDQFCRGCETPTKGRATALLTPGTRIWAPLCLSCFGAASVSKEEARDA